MNKTADITTGPVRTTAHPPRQRLGDISARLTGSAAIAFVVVVIGQNIIRGGSAPANDAPAAEVLKDYADHRSVTFALIAMFLVSGFALAIFLGGAMRRLIGSERQGWAFTGCAGGIGILALFASMVGAEEALSVLATRSQPDLGAIEALWALHNSIFTVLWLMIAVALFGLSRAGVAAGITPRAFERIAPVGSALLLIGSAGGPAIAAGDTMALFAAGGIGFLVWLAFLLTTGARLVRSSGAR